MPHGREGLVRPETSLEALASLEPAFKPDGKMIPNEGKRARVTSRARISTTRPWAVTP